MVIQHMLTTLAKLIGTITAKKGLRIKRQRVDRIM